MKRMLTSAVSLVLVLSLVTAPDMFAQTRRSSGGSTSSATRSSSSATTRSGSSGSTVSRSSSSSGSTATRSSASSAVRSSSSSGSATRSSSSSSSQQDVRRNNSGTSTGSATRSSSSSSSAVRSSSSSGSATRSSSSASSSSQQDVRRGSSSSTGSATRSSSSSGSAVRSSSSGSAASGSAVRSSSSSSGSSAVRASSENTATDRATRTQQSSSSAVRSSSSSNVSRAGLTSGSNTAVVEKDAARSGYYKDNGNNYRYDNNYRVDNNHDMHRIPPRQRDVLAWDRAGYFWGDHPHYYGYRIHTLPPSYRRISHWGIDYYFYEGVYYRPFGGVYVVCRPPFGTPLERAIDRAILRAIRFSYYCDVYRTYNAVFDYYNTIARQNLIVAQQNAREAARYASGTYALNANRALTAYELANKLGLVQSYAYAGSDYFYQDGVFYTITASGSYSTIIPPAGALVTSLPDDYEIIVMNGIEYFMVDNTVYRTTVFEGEPYLEVLGQMYGSLYNQYNVYR